VRKVAYFFKFLPPILAIHMGVLALLNIGAGTDLGSLYSFPIDIVLISAIISSVALLGFGAILGPAS